MKRKYYKFTDKYSKYLEQLHRKFALPDMKNRYYRNNSVNMSNAISCNGKEFSSEDYSGLFNAIKTRKP